MPFLYGTAATIGVIHTLLGPDHYLPFVAMSRAGRWSLARTVTVTLLCGMGHVLGSVLVGLVGIALGAAVFSLESIEAARGQIAGWLLIGFGLAYTAWGLRRAYRDQPHAHVHVHADGTVHAHEHVHDTEHAHVHHAHAHHANSPRNVEYRIANGEWRSAGALNPEEPRYACEFAPAPPRGMNSVGGSLTPWVLFTIFIFGPCEPLIPILMYPAVTQGVWAVLAVSAIRRLAFLGGGT